MRLAAFKYKMLPQRAEWDTLKGEPEPSGVCILNL